MAPNSSIPYRPNCTPILSWPENIQSYKQGKEIGSGNFATVFKGFLVSDPTRKCVMKISKLEEMDEETIKCQKGELNFLKELTHTNIVRGLAAFFADKKTYVLVLEDMGEQDLEDYIRHELLTNYKLIPEYRIWRYFVQLADALAFVHSRGIVHRDVKTANILKSNQLIKLSDFGLSKHIKPNEEFTEKCGTPFYLSPERMAMKSYNMSADIWSLGCVMYEMCTGVSPYFGERSNEHSLRMKIISSEYPPISESCYSFFVEDLVYSMLQKEPSYRPDSAFVASYARKVDNHFRAKFPTLPDY